MHRQTEEGQMISSITVKISKSDSFPKCHCSYQGQAIMPMTMWSYEGIRGTGNLLCALIFDSKAEAKFLHECLRMCRTFSSSSFLICQAEGNVGRPSLFFGVRLTHHQDWNETWVSEYLCIWLRSPFNWNLLKLPNHNEASDFDKALQHRCGLESTRLLVLEAGVHSGYIYMVHTW